MNSTEEISVYKDPSNLHSPTDPKKSTLRYSYDFPEKAVKKEKKWSIGNLFRRKKKGESGSSSDEEHKRGFLGRRRQKSDKRRKPRTVGGFDHIVIPKTSLKYHSYNYHEDGILSDPSGGFSSYVGRTVPLSPQSIAPLSYSTNNSLSNIDQSVAVIASEGLNENISKKKGRELRKARVAARRTTLGNESSSEEDSSIRSNSSLRIRSDESLAKPFQEVIHNRRTRGARTERYLKRHSKDGENPHNYLRLSKSDADRSPSRSPLPSNIKPYPSSFSSSQASNISGLSTIPCSQGTHGKNRVSNSTSNPSYKPPLSMNEYNNSSSNIKLNSQRSISCDADIHKVPADENFILHVQFPVIRPFSRDNTNLSLVEDSAFNSFRQPPQPPPRDPKRTVVPPYFENNRPNTVYFVNNSHPDYKSFYSSNTGPRYSQPKIGSFNLNPSYKSTSEMHIANDPYLIPNPARPASATPESKVNRYGQKNRNERHTVDGFNYLADKRPRSRKPIAIHSNITLAKNSNSHNQKPIDFWKQIEVSENNICSGALNNSMNKSISKSPQIFTSQTHVQSQVFLPNTVCSDLVDLESPKVSSPVKLVSHTRNPSYETRIKLESPKLSNNLESTPKDDIKRKSSNLEEALDELEAIYNSLRLGDENLLDRAEQRENETLIKRAEEKNKLAYLGYTGKKGALSDSSFNYEPFDQVDSTRRQNVRKKDKMPNSKDDMYNRKLVKEKSATISDPQTVLSKISYLLTSPLNNAYGSEDELRKINKINKEPDVTFDDLIYRSIKHAKDTPKTMEPQPPFGIPIGPVTPAPSSDYLHVDHKISYSPVLKEKKIPDIITDDLAFRNLRKDLHKDPILTPGSVEQNKNTIASKEIDLNYLKRRRAVRSLSANIGNILGKDNVNGNNIQSDCKKDTLSDIADAMEIAKRVLFEKEQKINDNCNAFMSDPDEKKISNGDSLKEKRRKFLNGLRDQENKQSKEGVTCSRKRIFERVPHLPENQSASALEKYDSTNHSLTDLLKAFAEEAKVTSERITREMQDLKYRRSNKVEDQKCVNVADDLECITPCRKLLKAVVDSTDLVEYNKSPCEVATEIQIKSPPAESANIVQSCFGKGSDEAKFEKEDHDYEIIDSDMDHATEEQAHRDESKKPPFEKCKSDLIASFQELKDNIDEMELPNFDNKKEESIYHNIEDTPIPLKANEGEPMFDACRSLSSNYNNSQVVSLNKLKYSDSEHSSCDSTRLDSLETLKSPQLVLDTSRKCLHGTSAIPTSSNLVLGVSRSPNSSTNSYSSNLSSSITPESKGQGETSNNISDDLKKSKSPWYHDPTTVAVACSYGLACAHQLASIDLVAILSLLFAIMSFIVALFL